ncbi:tubulin binding cofactor C-domain-containing protein [Lyophyllum atratum]|nr:tubulin binding cofactor C-domain-containing protein [Lyophyllum atratum]
MSDSTWSFSQTFSTQFQTSRSDLESRVDTAKSSSSASDELLQELLAESGRLAKSLADATGSLPSYDQRQYEEQLKALEKALLQLRGKSKPKSKFAFKRKAPVAHTTSSVPAPQFNSGVPGPALQPTTTNLSLSSHSHQYLTLESLPKSPYLQDLAISDLDHCIVNLIPPLPSDDVDQTPDFPLEISALHIRNLSDTVLLIPPIHGSVLIHELTRCTIVIGCHQFRMHTSHNVDVYLSILSNPVIEHCTDIRFGAYPSILSPATENKPSNHLSVMDFSHIRSTPSPHWSALDDDRVAPQWPLPRVTEQDMLNDVRERLLPK